MAGKIEGATGKSYGIGGGTNQIPTAWWEVQNVNFRPEDAGAMHAGAMLKKEYDKSRAANAGVKVP